MIKNVMALAATGLTLSASPYILKGCSDVDRVKQNAADVEKQLIDNVAAGKKIKMLPGFVVINYNLRDVPAVIDTNNAALVDGIPAERGTFVMRRPFIVENKHQLNNSDPKIWLAANDPRSGKYDFDGAEGKVFAGIGKATISSLHYYVKNGQQPANICPNGITGAFESSVMSSPTGDNYIMPDGFKKDVGFAEDMTSGMISQFIDKQNYHEVQPCR